MYGNCTHINHLRNVPRAARKLTPPKKLSLCFIFYSRYSIRRRRFAVGYTNAYTAYKETGVKTASQGKLIVLLYQEAVKQLGKALSFIGADNKVEPGDIEKLNNCIVKTQEILTELMTSLDMEKGGEIAKNLMALYVFFNKELLDANIKHDRQKIESVHRMMDELTNAWITAVESTAPVAQPVARPNIDING